MLWQFGPGKVTLTGNNSIPGGTTIAAGATLQAGNGGSTGAVGPGNVANDGTLIINRSVAQSLGAMNGVGAFVQLGTGTTTLTASNGASGPTTISNGTLVVSGRYLGGDLNVEGGTITPTAVAGNVASLNVAGNLTIDAGTLVIGLNKNLAQSNSVVNLTNELTLTAGTVTATGGTLKLINAGPAVQVGDKFTLFSQPVTGGGTMTIVSPGFTVANNLAVDGSVTVSAILPAPTITAGVVGNQLNLSWPAGWTGGVHLQGQTNTLAVGISTNWVTIPGTDLSNTYSTAINPTNRAVFFRLINP